jgi:hypothetical protein
MRPPVGTGTKPPVSAASAHVRLNARQSEVESAQFPRLGCLEVRLSQFHGSWFVKCDRHSSKITSICLSRTSSCRRSSPYRSSIFCLTLSSAALGIRFPVRRRGTYHLFFSEKRNSYDHNLFRNKGYRRQAQEFQEIALLWQSPVISIQKPIPTKDM